MEDAEEAIGAALDALRTLMQESIRRVGRCIRFTIAEPPVDTQEAPHLRMISPHTAGIASSRAAPMGKMAGRVALVEQPMLNFDAGYVDFQQLHRKNHLTLELALAKCLEDLRISPGRVELRALMGSFVFGQLPEPPAAEKAISIASFLTKLRDTRTWGHLYRLCVFSKHMINLMLTKL